MNFPTAITVEWTLKRRGGAQAKPVAPDAVCQARIPRLARLMALAIKFQDMIDRGEVCDYADLARLGHVSRARTTQIMNLLHLAPDIQEQLIELRIPDMSDQLPTERHIRKVVEVIDWTEQRQRWHSILSG